MSAFCVYCCASPLFLSSVLMAHLNKVLDVSEASSTNPEATRSTTRCYVTSHWHEEFEWVNNRVGSLLNQSYIFVLGLIFLLF